MDLLAAINPFRVPSGFVFGMLVGLICVGGGSVMTPFLVLVFGVHATTAVGPISFSRAPDRRPLPCSRPNARKRKLLAPFTEATASTPQRRPGRRRLLSPAGRHVRHGPAARLDANPLVERAEVVTVGDLDHVVEPGPAGRPGMTTYFPERPGRGPVSNDGNRSFHKWTPRSSRIAVYSR
jgi:hypothetical protein